MIQYGTGPFEFFHLLFLLVVVGELGVAAYKFKDIKKYQEEIQVLLRVAALVLVVLVCIRQITAVKNQMQNDASVTWWSVLPDTMCAFSSLGLGLCTLFGTKDNRALHFFWYMALFTGLATTVYPSYLAEEDLLSFGVIARLLYGALDIAIALFLLLNKSFIPSLRKMPYFLGGLVAMMGFGALEIYTLGYPNAMCLNEPWMEGPLSWLTSWYCLAMISIVCAIGIAYSYHRWAPKNVEDTSPKKVIVKPHTT